MTPEQKKALGKSVDRGLDAIGDTFFGGDTDKQNPKVGQTPPSTAGGPDTPGILENRKARDRSKNEKHGDGGRAMDSADKAIEGYLEDLKNATTRREKNEYERK